MTDTVHVLYAVSATLVLACLGAIPLLGWQAGFGSVAGAVLGLAVFGAQMRAERHAHNRWVRELRAETAS